jgi:hypothetical protein
MELEITMGPEGLQKIMIVSHERSGTHFLMNTIAQNFGYVSTDWIDMDMNFPLNYYNPDSINEFFEALEDKPIATIFKSHHQVDFFLPFLSDMLKNFFIFYVYRDGKDVMESFSTHLNDFNKHWFAGPTSEDGRELAKMAPCGGMMRYQWYQHDTVWDRWQAHVDGWLNRVPLSLKNRVITIRFEELNEQFDSTVRFIANRIGIVAPEHPIRPSKFENVILPDEKKEASYGKG